MGILGNQECFGRGKGREDMKVFLLFFPKFGAEHIFREFIFFVELGSILRLTWVVLLPRNCKKLLFSLVFIFLATFLWREK